jgi:hypothetical protein
MNDDERRQIEIGKLIESITVGEIISIKCADKNGFTCWVICSCVRLEDSDVVLLKTTRSN